VADLGRRQLVTAEVDAVDDRVDRCDRVLASGRDDRRVIADATKDPSGAWAERRLDRIDELEFVQSVFYRWR
jgi:hypothetical protein